MLSGGKVIGTGTYSCIFDPPLRCKVHATQPKGHNITKLIEEDQADTEWSISKRISKIPLWRNYFSISESICEPAEVQKDKELHTKCELLDDYDMSQLRLLTMKYAGNSLQSYKFPASFQFIPFITHLLEAGALMALNRFMHFDLHAGNILIDEHQIPRIIDFNLSVMVDEFNVKSQLIYDYSHNYGLTQQSPDYTVTLGFNQDKDINRIIQTILSKPIIRYLSQFLRIPLVNIQNDLYKIMNENAFIVRGDMTEWFNTYWMKYDSWSIGIYLINMIKRLHMMPFIGHAYQRHRAKLTTLLSHLCAIDPTKRWDCVQALYYMNPNSIIIKRYAQNWLHIHGHPR